MSNTVKSFFEIFFFSFFVLWIIVHFFLVVAVSGSFITLCLFSRGNPIILASFGLLWLLQRLKFELVAGGRVLTCYQSLGLRATIHKNKCLKSHSYSLVGAANSFCLCRISSSHFHTFTSPDNKKKKIFCKEMALRTVENFAYLFTASEI